MQKHINGIDHVVIVVRNLDAARDAFRRMGFTVTPRGLHSLGSQNHCVMFGHDYIELLWSPEGPPHPSRQYYTEFARAAGHRGATTARQKPGPQAESMGHDDAGAILDVEGG